MQRRELATLVLAVGTWFVIAAASTASLRARCSAWLGVDGPAQGAERAHVEAVVDGDTVRLDDGTFVRVLGLDAPETNNPAMRGPQPLGPEATELLRDLVEGRDVSLEADVTDRDHYGRSLRHVWVGRTLAAEVLLREGLARSMSVPPNIRYADRMRAAEAEAREASRGLWGLPRPTSLPIFATALP